MESMTNEELLTIIEQAECTITEAANKLAAAIRELKGRDI